MSEIQELQAALESTGKLYSLVRQLIINVSVKAKAGELKKTELCDVGFLCREISAKADEIRKDVNATKILVDKIMSIKVMQETLTDATKPQIVHGEFASGTPQYKKAVTLPRKDTIEYSKMMRYFGVTDKGNEMGAVKVRWQQVCKHVTELVELGKPIPDFLPKIHDDYSVVHRRKTM